jgi:WD40 repeat protein
MTRLAWVPGLCLLVAAGAAAQQTPELSGKPSAEVKALQQRLTADGCYRGVTDGHPDAALQAAVASCPPQDPILRIESGMHSAAIMQISVDRTCRIAATGSADKTVRIWSLPDGRLLRTLRVPIDADNGGQIAATAESPDGHWVAAGGWDVNGTITHQAFVYIFDVSTGAIVARVGPFDNVIHHLAFSPEGRWLAATSGIGVGLKLIDTQTWRIAEVDQAYYGESYGVALGADGRVFTVAYDGKLRLYRLGPSFRKEREIRTRSGRQPYSVAVDPSGQLIAVGFNDSAKVDIYDAATLRFRFAADTRGVEDGNLGAVAWSTDGARLFAGGTYEALFQGSWKRPVLSFGRDGRRIGDPLPISDDSIQSIAPCGDAVAVGASDPDFELIDLDGRIRLRKTGIKADMRNKLGAAFAITADAKQVRFGLGYGIDQPVLFDVAEATLTNAPNLPAGFALPLTQGLPVSNWQNEDHPSFAGRPLRLNQVGEMSRSLAVRSDLAGFALGTSFYLYDFNAQGQLKGQKPAPGEVWGINLSADGRIIVAAYDDGTIRWLRWSDGKELLALFVDKVDKRWVAWTPSGYYMASPGGEDLIGWHINRGWNQAPDFFPASRFRDRFNRPDIVQLVLNTLDEDAAVNQANALARRREDTRPLIEHLPPVIRIADPADGASVTANKVTLDYAVRSPSGQPVDRLDLVINGRPVKSIGLPIASLNPDAESRGSIPVTLTQHVSEIGLIAWSAGLASQAAQITVTWDGAPEATRKLYALVIGVSDYADPAMALKYAAKDATDFAKALADQKGRYYADIQTRVLTDRVVTRASIIQGLQWLEKSVTNPNDVTVLFLAGHGTTDEKQTYWFYTSDSNDGNVSINGVSQDEIRKSLQGLQGKVLWFLDTCHAGAAAKRSPVDMNVLVNTVSASENGGIVVFASSTGRQVSVEAADLGNGAFTKAVVEGIDLGKAALGNGFITTSTLDSYVVQRVEEFTGNQQTPVMERPPEEPDFAIAEMKR